MNFTPIALNSKSNEVSGKGGEIPSNVTQLWSGNKVEVLDYSRLDMYKLSENNSNKAK